MHIVARSISQPVWERLCKGPFAARVLAVFKHACNLVTLDGHVVALVLPQVGDGPLNVVVHGRPGDFAAVEPGMSARLEGRRLRVGGLEIVLEGAVVWEPCPDWDSLRAGRDGITARLPFLWAFALRNAPAGSLLPLAWEWAGGPDHSIEAVEAGCVSRAFALVARDAAEALWAGWGGDPGRLREGAAQLAGLGSGLTPAGDDFLTGVMLWAWLAHSNPRVFCRTLAAAAIPRTTTLSAAFLRAAAEGECNVSWHRALAAMVGTEDVLASSILEVLAHGATSGADALAGFLWMDSYAGA
ncbi:MAG: DUF2877 domain-containing protein [Chloroflexota bacterium]|nr:DUF2877 domain-containing protein [Chloroflexota bacterium]